MSWGGPESLGGNLFSSPSATSWGSGRLDIFGVDNVPANPTLQHWFWQNSWLGPDLIGGSLNLNFSPSPVSWAAGRLDIFGVDGNTAALVVAKLEAMHLFIRRGLHVSLRLRLE